MTDRTHPGTGCVYRDMGGPCPAKTAAEEALIVAALAWDLHRPVRVLERNAWDDILSPKEQLSRNEARLAGNAYATALDAVKQERGQ